VERYTPRSHALDASRNPTKPGTFLRLETDRPWRQVAGPPVDMRLATIGADDSAAGDRRGRRPGSLLGYLKRRDYENKISVDDVAFSVYILVCIKSRGLRPRQPANRARWIPKGDAATSATKRVVRECQPSSDQTGGGFFNVEWRTIRARGIWFQIASPCRSQNWLKRSLP
jgi:hypothetical protein